MADAGELESELRQALAEAGVDWLLQQVDVAIAEGRPIARRKEGTDTGLAGVFDAKDVEITAAPFNARERVELLIEAVRRAFVAAPGLAREVDALLHQDWADAVRFVPSAREEDARPAPSPADVGRGARAATDLERILRDVESQIGDSDTH